MDEHDDVAGVAGGETLPAPDAAAVHEAADPAPAPEAPPPPAIATLAHADVVGAVDDAWNALVPTAHASPEQWQHARIFMAEVKHRLAALFGA